jgi:hypothetical protein
MVNLRSQSGKGYRGGAAESAAGLRAGGPAVRPGGRGPRRSGRAGAGLGGGLSDCGGALNKGPLGSDRHVQVRWRVS